MKNIELKSRKLLRKIFNCFSITAVAFIFQACYGPGPDMYHDVKFTGTVTSKTTNLPVEGIKVVVDEGYNFGFTDKNGKFDFYANVPGCFDSSDVNIHFRDVDGMRNDTTIVVNPACQNEVKINVELSDRIDQ